LRVVGLHQAQLSDAVLLPERQRYNCPMSSDDSDAWPKSQDFFILRRHDRDLNATYLNFSEEDSDDDEPAERRFTFNMTPKGPIRDRLSHIYEEDPDYKAGRLVSPALFELLHQAAPDALDSWPAPLKSEETDETFQYFFVRVKDTVPAHNSDEAKTGELQWGSAAFLPEHVSTRRLFRTGTTRHTQLLIVDAKLADAIRARSLPGVGFSELKITP
jgi:hypothetical protein